MWNSAHYVTPKTRQRLVSAETIGYFGGPYPFLPLVINNERVNVYSGQVIAVHGKIVQVVGAFARSAALQIFYDYPVNSIGHENWDKHFLTYYTAHTQPAISSRKGASAFHLKQGRVEIDYTITDGTVSVLLVRDVPDDILEVDYSDFINDRYTDIEHANGEQIGMDTLVHRAGYFRSFSYDIVKEAAGIQDHQIKYISANSSGGSFNLEADTLAIFFGEAGNDQIMFSFQIRDLGVYSDYGLA